MYDYLGAFKKISRRLNKKKIGRRVEAGHSVSV